jgi:prepilin-type N-terminal cleavage/methylation domain-containing protein
MFRAQPTDSSHDRRLGAFTLTELMIVVAVIGMLAALAVPAMARARKQSQGRRIVNDARIIDGAIDQWAIDNGKTDGAAIDNWSQAGIVSYTGDKWTITAQGALMFNDVLGNSYSFATVGWNPQVSVNYTSRIALSGVGVDWGIY